MAAGAVGDEDGTGAGWKPGTNGVAALRLG